MGSLTFHCSSRSSPWLEEQEGVSLTAKDDDGWQPIHVACFGGHLELVKWLAEQEGVSLAAKDNGG